MHVIHTPYMHITRSVHALSTNTTHRLHAFYVRVGAAIPLTVTVFIWNSISKQLL